MIRRRAAPHQDHAPNVAVTFQPHLRRCFDAFGPRRMFWSTDITRMPCSQRQCVTLFTEELPWLKGRDLDLVMRKALYNWVGWPLPTGCRGARQAFRFVPAHFGPGR